MSKLAALASVLALTACAVDDLDETDDAITNANPTTGAAYAVQIQAGPLSCSAVTLSKHWLITAAHCFSGQPGSANLTVYRGTYPGQKPIAFQGYVDVYIDPAYDSSDPGSDTSVAHDVALVRMSGTGLDVFTTIKVYSGPETPWTTRGSTVDAIGYGWGSDPGGREDCSSETDHTDLTFGTKRRAHFAFTGAGENNWDGVDIYSSIRSLCHGDSGGPSVLVRNGEDYLVGLFSYGFYWLSPRQEEPRIDPKMAWIQQIASFVTPALSCPLVRDHRYTVEVDYRVCSEL
jgi:trypsin